MKFFQFLLVLFFSHSVFGYRSPPEKVESVVINNIEYGSDGSVLQAKDLKTKKVLWTKSVYKIRYIEGLERDIQLVYIKSITLSKDKKYLLIVNEREDNYHLDLKTKEVFHITRFKDDLEKDLKKVKELRKAEEKERKQRKQ